MNAWRHIVSAVLMAALTLSSTSCPGGSLKQRRCNRSKIQDRLEKIETPGLLIGEFPLAFDAVLDGDTIQVEWLKSSLRLLCIDTEETFKSDEDRRLFEEGFEAYLKAKRADSLKPVKAATPLGEEAKLFAKKFFEDSKVVSLERDQPKEIRGRYNRFLAYVFAKKDGVWVNYNIECVRAGMSPYFTKYGYSRRFHDEFVAAEKEARRKRIGVWSPDGMHYADYPERIRWWNDRADFIKQFEEKAARQDNMIVLTNWDAMRRLNRFAGREVVLLGSVGEIKLGDRGPIRVMLSRRQFADFPLIFFDKNVFKSSRIARFKGEFVRVRGVVSRYHNKRKNRHELQMVIDLPGQVVGTDKLPDYSGWDTEEKHGREPPAASEG